MPIGPIYRAHRVAKNPPLPSPVPPLLAAIARRGTGSEPAWAAKEIPDMKLILKFNLVFVAIFLIGLGVAGYVSHQLLQQNAREEALQNARLVMETALATRAYTASQVGPLLETQLKYGFLPQSIPAYSATEVVSGLRKAFGDYTYKEAALNPTNPRDRAVEWEADVVNRFRNGYDRAEIIGERETPTGRALYIARPIQIKDPSCLACHSTVEAAPKTVVDRYGPANGFGWQLNEIVGAQVVSVPTEVPSQRAAAAYRTFMLSLTGVFVFIGIGLNLMLLAMVIRPVSQLSRLADRVSLGDVDVPDFNARGRDEIGVLAESFNRMKKSVVQAMKLLGD
jgi:protein-histidine pros-kinase